LTELCNAIVSEGTIPEDWNGSVIIPVFVCLFVCWWLTAHQHQQGYLVPNIGKTRHLIHPRNGGLKTVCNMYEYSLKVNCIKKLKPLC
jgi:hypothetical protein